MPPRYVYWTILIDNRPTSFRARDKEELLPTVGQLRRTNKDVVVKYFAHGRVWESPEEAREHGRKPATTEKRGRDWRPGGGHEDPRARFDKNKKEQRKHHQHPPSGTAIPSEARKPGAETENRRPWTPKPGGAKRPWTPRPKSEERPWQDKNSAAPNPRPWTKPAEGKRPWTPKPDGERRPWQNKSTGPGGAGESTRPAGTNKPGWSGEQKRPWTPKPGGAKRPWTPRPKGEQRPWQDKNSGAPNPRPWSKPADGKRPWTPKPDGARRPWQNKSTRPDGTGEPGKGTGANKPGWTGEQRRPWTPKPDGGKRPWTPKPEAGKRPWSPKPESERRPWQNKPSGDRATGRPDRADTTARTAQPDRPDAARKPDRGGESPRPWNTKGTGGKRPWTPKPKGERRPWQNKSASAGKKGAPGKTRDSSSADAVKKPKAPEDE